ncbi:hypothetical protein ABZ366_26380, partial [Streptomyces sp. NPDC005904]
MSTSQFGTYETYEAPHDPSYEPTVPDGRAHVPDGAGSGDLPLQATVVSVGGRAEARRAARRRKAPWV